METIKVIEYTDCSFKETPEYLSDKYYTNISLYYYKEEVVNIEIDRVDNNFYASVELLYYGYFCSCGRIVREEEIYGKPAKEVAKIIIEGLSGKYKLKMVKIKKIKEESNMLWKDAFNIMKEGGKIKLPSWSGYWYWDKDKQSIFMHCKDGSVMDIRETVMVDYTFSNIGEDQWMVATKENCPVLGGTIEGYDFSDALRYLKRGCKVARKGWNGKNMHIEKKEIDGVEVFLTITGPTGRVNTWVPSISDLFAEDWVFVE